LFASLILFLGCQKDDSDEAETIVSNSAVNPVASFTSSQQGQDLESRYTWNFSSVLENTSVFVWDFGDGNTSSEANPSHTYERAGTYTVILTVYGIPASGSILGPDDQVTQSITIEGPQTIDYLIGSWSPRNLKVGPYPGAGDWWNYNFSGGRPCLEDDVYTFSSDGSLTINHGSETWLENWQTGSGDYCGAPVAPYINGIFSWSFDNDVVTVTGDGAYLVLAKAHNNGEDGGASTRSYSITNISTTTMQVTIDVSGGAGSVWWTYDLVKN
jgi:PKD repeat protein